MKSLPQLPERPLDTLRQMSRRIAQGDRGKFCVAIGCCSRIVGSLVRSRGLADDRRRRLAGCPPADKAAQ